jgi:F0F1-type ATP synthase assembly protein I
MKMFPKAKPPSPGADEGWAVLGSLMSGLLLFGGLGWLLDQWWDVRVMAPVGAVVGMALGIYAVVMRHGVRAAATPETSELTSSARAKADAARALREAKTANRRRALRPTGSVARPDAAPCTGTRKETVA